MENPDTHLVVVELGDGRRTASFWREVSSLVTELKFHADIVGGFLVQVYLLVRDVKGK